MNKIPIIIAFATISLPTFSQEIKLPEVIRSCDKVSIHEISMEKVGKELKVSFSVTPAKKPVRSNYKMTLTPYLYNNSDTISLEPIEIVGRQWVRKEKQRQRLTGNIMEAANRIIPTNEPSRYQISLPYRKYMDHLSLRLLQTVEGCCTAKIIGNEELANNLALRTSPIAYKVMPQVSYITPEVESVKVRQESGVAYIQFESGKYRLLSSLGSNKQEINKIRESIDLVSNNKFTEIKQISLVGYASPEGTWAYNSTLSKNRTKIIADYVRDTYKLPMKIFCVKSLSEDWNTLAQLVAVDTTLSLHKEVLLSIINSDADPDLKDRQILNFEKGVPYKYILATLYPKLRRTVYRIDYTVKGFTIDQSRDIIKTRPYDLSLSELFLLANSYPTGSKEYNEVFESALSAFPDDTIVNSNAAAAAIECGDIERAGRYLSKAGNDPQTENNRGVFYLLNGEYEKAEQAFQRALTAGVAEAAQNIEQLRRKIESVREISEYESVE